jgi:glucose-6-phosphate dehydrogenase assembly protein OpcA
MPLEVMELAKEYIQKMTTTALKGRMVSAIPGVIAGDVAFVMMRWWDNDSSSLDRWRMRRMR